MTDVLTIDDVNADDEGDCYKFVLVGDEFRFLHSNSVHSHQSMVGPDEVATDAGVIATFAHYWRMYDRLSSTLEIGCSSEAEAKLCELLNRSYKSQYD